jgi:small subunit ribosomal protein S21
MLEVKVRQGELIDKALKRLKNKVITSGLIDELYHRRAFETKAVKKARKRKMAAKKAKLLNSLRD